MAKLPRPRNLCSYLIAGALFLILLTACLSPSGGTTKPAARQHEWAEALRALDLADTPTPAYDLTAVYLRRQDNLLQIRVDLLDFKNPKDLSLEIRVEDNAAPQAPPLTLRIPSQTERTCPLALLSCRE